MASYGIQFQPAQPSFASGISQGVSGANDLFGEYIRAMLSRKISDQWDTEKQEKSDRREKLRQDAIRDALKQARQDKSLEVEEEYSDKGLSFKAKRKNVDVDKAFRHVMAGIGTPEEEAAIGQRAHVQEPPAEIPGMTMLDGSVGMIPNEGASYSDAIRQSLMPSYTKEQIAADYVGLPQRNAVADEADFSEDLKAAIAESNDDENVFVEKLQELSKKYATDSNAQKHIRELMQINKPRKQDLFGDTSTWK